MSHSTHTSWLNQFQSDDRDFRFMGTSDLLNELSTAMLKLLRDPSSEVQSLAMKCLPLLAARVSPNAASSTAARLSVRVLPEAGGSAGKSSSSRSARSSSGGGSGDAVPGSQSLRDVAGLALKPMVATLPSGGPSAVAIIAPYVSDMLLLALALSKLDPRYTNGGAGCGEDGDDMEEDAAGSRADGVEYDEDGFREDERDYSDDEDASWRVRRAAVWLCRALVQVTRVMAAVKGVSSRGTYVSISQTLSARFSEREEVVKLDVSDAFSGLLAVIASLLSSSSASRMVSATASTATASVPSLLSPPASAAASLDLGTANATTLFAAAPSAKSGLPVVHVPAFVGDADVEAAARAAAVEAVTARAGPTLRSLSGELHASRNGKGRAVAAAVLRRLVTVFVGTFGPSSVRASLSPVVARVYDAAVTRLSGREPDSEVKAAATGEASGGGGATTAPAEDASAVGGDDADAEDPMAVRRAEDAGLEQLKAALAAIVTLLHTAPRSLLGKDVADVVSRGLRDGHPDVGPLTTSTLRAAVFAGSSAIAPAALVLGLRDATPLLCTALGEVLFQRVEENAVRKEVQRQDEAVCGALRALRSVLSVDALQSHPAVVTLVTRLLGRMSGGHLAMTNL
ncbi:hypothetical protein MMPV_008757 [Pyropia vietnamensis]